jgi:tyrosinase
MAEYTRANAWNNDGTFDNPDLLWYAKGVGAMQERALDDPASWWFFASIHGQYINPPESSFPGWQLIQFPPSVPTSPLPSQSVQDQYWDQCQHQTWYFLPWHRGYLLALEAQIRAEVINLGGPETWALPYWNYLGPGNESNIPPAFMEPTLPDGDDNPLFVDARYGPNNDGDIFVPVPPVNQDCMSNDVYTGNDAVTPPPGFGGPQTGFSHSGGTSGNIENNPHNLVHVFVGGSSPDGQTWGLMSDPGLAGLDPIFYLHHANIDRMWAAWNANPSNANPTDPTWLNGPASIGERGFAMPWPDGSSWVYTPAEVNSLDQLDYTYDDLPVPAPAPAEEVLAERLTRLGAAPEMGIAPEGAAVASNKNVELVGANRGPIAIKGAETRTTVKLDQDVRGKVSASFGLASESAPPDRIFLNLENVRGTQDASVLNVYINLPEGANPNDHPEHLAGSVGLFGLRRASSPDGRHGGQGLNFVLEITRIVDALHLENALDADSLHVRIVPYQPVPEQANITVERISVYRQEQ